MSKLVMLPCEAAELMENPEKLKSLPLHEQLLAKECIDMYFYEPLTSIPPNYNGNIKKARQDGRSLSTMLQGLSPLTVNEDQGAIA